MDLKIDELEKREEAYQEESILTSKPQYPSGLKLYLDPATVKKLGINANPKVGEKFPLKAMAEVCAVRNESMDGKPRLCVELQITDMDIVKEEKSAAEKLYG